MGKENKILWLLVAVLIFSWMSWSNTKKLQQQVHNLQQELNSVRSQVASEVSSVRGIVQGVRDDARWWIPGQVDFLDVSEGEATIEVNWQMREYQKGSEVTLNYKKPGEDQYISVDAVEKADGYFSATIYAEVSPKPQWHISSTSRSGQTNQSISNVAVEEVAREIKEKYANPNINYYVVVKKDDVIRSSDKQIIYLEHLGAMLYSRLDTHIHYNMTGGTVSIDVFEVRTPDSGAHVEELTLVSKRVDGTIVEELVVEREDTRDLYHIPYRITVEPEQDFDYWYLNARYSNGTEAKKEIPKL
ncbi:type II secretory pathway pseudopilin PulG [Desulfitispora alkaliphila]|uniref:hypothetical protein n=1 Tax=Desulfitispora alkaliphila TaxID=622674 RepID=UPI003D234FBD